MENNYQAIFKIRVGKNRDREVRPLILEVMLYGLCILLEKLCEFIISLCLQKLYGTMKKLRGIILILNLRYSSVK